MASMQVSSTGEGEIRGVGLGQKMASMEACSTRAHPRWTPPTIFDLLPELSDEEKEHLRMRGFSVDPEDYFLYPPTHPAPPCARERETSMIATIHHAIDHYNARHPGGEFDAVKPLMEDSAIFRNKAWFHINFWARSRSSKKIKRFFAEVHYEAAPYCPGVSLPPIAIIEACVIIEEPLSQYRNSCVFCHDYMDILHPMDDSEFVCGSGNKDWMIREWHGMLFISSGRACIKCSQLISLKSPGCSMRKHHTSVAAKKAV